MTEKGLLAALPPFLSSLMSTWLDLESHTFSLESSDSDSGCLDATDEFLKIARHSQQEKVKVTQKKSNTQNRLRNKAVSAMQAVVLLTTTFFLPQTSKSS